MKVTSTSYFLVKGGVNWNVAYIPNVTAANTVQTSNNNGNSWTNFAGTTDMHVHQYAGNETFYYYVCANDSLNNANCSSIMSDMLDLVALPPNAPAVYSPLNQTYSGKSLMSINYTASSSPVDYAIKYYNISLVDSNSNYIETIMGNNSLNLSYLWNFSSKSDGAFKIRVEACDEMGLCSFGYSETFTIDNTLPFISNLISNKSNNITRSDAQLNFTVTATDANIANVTLNNSLMIQSGSTYYLVTTPSTLGCLTEGACLLQATATDAANNSNSTTYTLTIDNTLPFISNLISNKSNNITRSDAQLNFTVNATDFNLENVTINGLLMINVEGDLFSLSATPASLGCTTGYCLITAVTTDSAGNENNILYYLTIDETLPNVSLNSPFDNLIISNQTWQLISFDCSATDSSGIEKIEFYLTDPFNQTLMLNSTSLTSSITPSFNLSIGNYTWNCKAYDVAENANWAANRSIMIFDNTPPEITNIETNPILPLSTDSNFNLSINFSSNEFPLNATLQLFNGSNLVYSNNIFVTSTSDLPIIFTPPSNLTDGNYTLNLSIVDSFGNLNVLNIGDFEYLGIKIALSIYLPPVIQPESNYYLRIDFNSTGSTGVVNITYGYDSVIVNSELFELLFSEYTIYRNISVSGAGQKTAWVNISWLNNYSYASKQFTAVYPSVAVVYPTATPSPTPTATPTITLMPTIMPSVTPTPTIQSPATPILSLPSPTPLSTPTIIPTPTIIASPTITPVPTMSATPTPTTYPPEVIKQKYATEVVESPVGKLVLDACDTSVVSFSHLVGLNEENRAGLQSFCGNSALLLSSVSGISAPNECGNCNLFSPGCSCNWLFEMNCLFCWFTLLVAIAASIYLFKTIGTVAILPLLIGLLVNCCFGLQLIVITLASLFVKLNWLKIINFLKK